MATYIKTLKDANGDTVLPRTNSSAVTMGSGTLADFEAQLDSNEERLDVLEGTEAVDGSVLKSVKDNAEDGTLTDAENRYTASTVKGALAELAGDGRTTETVKDNADAISALSGRLDTLEGADTVDGSVLKSIKDNAENATYDNTTSGLTADTLGGAIDEVEGRVDDVDNAIDAIKGTGYTEGSLKTHEDRLDVLEADVSTEGSVLKDIKDTAKDATYDNSVSGLIADTLNEAIDELDERVDDTETALSTLNGADTVVGSVAKTVKDAVDPIESRLDTTELTLARQGQDIASVKQTIQQGNGATLDFEDIGSVALDARATGRANPTVEGITATNLVVNGDFSLGTIGWDYYSSSGVPAIEGDYITEYLSTTTSAFGQEKPLIANHVYYLACIAKMATNPVTDANFTVLTSGVLVETSSDVSIDTSDTFVSTIMTASIAHEFFGIGRVGSADTVYIKKNSFVVVDLTSTFGSGNEPSEADCAKIFSYFDGTKSIQMPARVRSVGKNLFNGELESGAISTSTGLDDSQVNTSRTVNFIQIEPNADYSLSGTARPLGATVAIFWYDKDLNYISYSSFLASGGTDTSPENARWCRFQYGAPYPNEYLPQLELGSTATTYEPYQDSTLYIADDSELRSVPAITDEVNVVNGEVVKVQNVAVGVLGVEKVVNGAFDTDTAWTKGTGWSIAGGKAIASSSPAGNTIYQQFLLTTGKLYKFEIHVSSLTSGTLRVGSLISGSSVIGCSYAISETGVHTGYFIAQGGNLYIIPLTPLTAEIESISIKEISTSEGIPVQLYIGKNTYVTDDGTNGYYQLAVPIITPLLTSGILQAKPNGTVYFEPWYEGSHQTDASSQITLPYEGTIDKLTGYDENLEPYEVPSTGYTLVGTTLTVTGAEENEVFYVQMSRSEPLAPEMSVNVINNDLVLLNDTDGKYYEWKMGVTGVAGSLTPQIIFSEVL